MALVDLARFDNINPVTLRDISLRQGISLDFLEQIFSKLKKNQIVKSIRGNQGGYILSKDPSEIKKLIGKTAKLTFRFLANNNKDEFGYENLTGKNKSEN